MTPKRFSTILIITILLYGLAYRICGTVLYEPDSPNSIIKILIIAFTILSIVSAFGLLIAFAIRHRFETQYNLKLHTWEIRICARRKSIIQAQYQLKYPYWQYSKRDGTADLRRRQNFIIWQKSTLAVDNYLVTSKRQYHIVTVVEELRHNGIYIQPCKEESDKYDKLKSQKLVYVNSHSIQDIVDQFSECPTEFENFCANLFQKMGYATMVTPPTNDGGYDIWLERDEKTAIVECKCYCETHSVGRPVIQKLVGANSVKGADSMFLITTSNFSAGAIQYAQEVGVELINGSHLLVLLKQYGLVDKKDAPIYPSEWQWTVADMKPYVPADIYQKYFF